MQWLWASNAPHRTPFSRGTLAKKFRWLIFDSLWLFLKTRIQIAKHWKRLHIPSNRHILSQGFFILLRTWKTSSIACSTSMWKMIAMSCYVLLGCTIVADIRPLESLCKRPGATRSDHERPGPRNWSWPQVLAPGHRRSFADRWTRGDGINLHPPWIWCSWISVGLQFLPLFSFLFFKTNDLDLVQIGRLPAFFWLRKWTQKNESRLLSWGMIAKLCSSSHDSCNHWPRDFFLDASIQGVASSSTISSLY